MFNTTIIKPTKEIATTVNHHEHRAPTDKSVELLNEMQEKALKNTMLLFRVQNSHVDAVMRVTESPATMTKTALVRYTIGGCEYTDEINLTDVQFKSPNELQEYLIEEWRKLVTSAVMQASKDITISNLLGKKEARNLF